MSIKRTLYKDVFKSHQIRVNIRIPPLPINLVLAKMTITLTSVAPASGEKKYVDSNRLVWKLGQVKSHGVFILMQLMLCQAKRCLMSDFSSKYSVLIL